MTQPDRAALARYCAEEATACTNELYYRHGPNPHAILRGDATYVKETIEGYLQAAALRAEDGMREARRDGHSKLVYNKTTRTIDTVDPHPQSAPVYEAALRADDGLRKAHDPRSGPCPTCGFHIKDRSTSDG